MDIQTITVIIHLFRFHIWDRSYKYIYVSLLHFTVFILPNLSNFRQCLDDIFG